MKQSVIQASRLIIIFTCLTQLSRGAQVVLILRPTSTSWQTEEAEKITVNGKEKLRAGSVKKLELSAEEYKRIPAELILQAGILRRHSGGYLARKIGGSWEPVAPDGAAVKGATSYAALWSSATIAIQKER